MLHSQLSSTPLKSTQTAIMDAATIEETNRIRVSLGMKPLPVPGAVEDPTAADSNSDESDGELASTVETRQAESYDNYRKVLESQAAQKKREERKAAIKKERDKALRLAKLEGAGLGEADENDPVDAKAWLTGQKKRQKQIEKARKLEQQLAAAEAEAAAAVQYTSKDLAGIKVAHDTSAFLDGDEQILTLKDATVGDDDEEGDELENLNLREQEELNDRLSLKKKLPGYNPNDDAEEEGGILAQYDEEIDGKKRKKFTLDATGMNAELADILSQPVERSQKTQNVSLDDLVGDAPISSDYLAPSEIKIKKPKKKKNKGTRQKQHDEDDIFPLEPAKPAEEDAMDIDLKGNAPVKKRKPAVDDFGDDDDLQASLAIQRKNALKKRKKTRPEDVAKQLKEQEEAESKEALAEEEEGGLVIGEVSEFVFGLNKPEEEDHRRTRRRTTTKSPGLELHEDATMEDVHNEEHGANPTETEDPSPPDNSGVEQEKVVGSGVGDTVALLRERGFWERKEASEVHINERQREEFLARKRNLEAELDEQTRQHRERDRASGKLDKMTTREREEWAQSQNKWRDQQQSKRMAELFSATYKPNVKLQYTDEHGRSLDQKEAFKHLSHQFHGKGSGKGKTEKMLKKIGDEQRREAQSMFDASSNGGMSVAAQQQLKKRREAGVRLG